MYTKNNLSNHLAVGGANLHQNGKKIFLVVVHTNNLRNPLPASRANVPTLNSNSGKLISK